MPADPSPRGPCAIPGASGRSPIRPVAIIDALAFGDAHGDPSCPATGLSPSATACHLSSGAVQTGRARARAGDGRGA